VPPGWTQRDAAGNAYGEFTYDLNANHTVVHHGHAATDYLIDVLSGVGTAFIKRQAATHTPFALEIATFCAARPGYAGAGRYEEVRAPDGAPYPRRRHAAHRGAILAQERAVAGRGAAAQRRRRVPRAVQAVQAVGRMIAEVRTTLAAAGVANDTYVVFSSEFRCYRRARSRIGVPRH